MFFIYCQIPNHPPKNGLEHGIAEFVRSAGDLTQVAGADQNGHYSNVVYLSICWKT